MGTALCLANTKACFGSCPTFYASDGERLALQGEGFSSAVARTLEQTDVDTLYTARPAGRELALTMTNDALETHFVRSVRVLSVLTRRRGFVPVGAFDEVGPIAVDVQLFVLPGDLPDAEVQIRLRQTRGNWKLQALALAELLPQVVPVPVEVRHQAGIRPRGRNKGTDPGTSCRPPSSASMGSKPSFS